MKIQVLKTTDGKHEGNVFEVPEINYEVCLVFGMKADKITWDGEYCTLQNSNYTIKLREI